MTKWTLGWLVVARNTFKNWLKIIILLSFRSDSMTVHLREDNFKYNWKRIQVLNHLVAKKIQLSETDLKIYPRENKVKFSFKNQILSFYGYQQNGWIQKEMTNFEYNKLHFSCKIVIDIGANSGATSIYFAMNGAKKVIAVEPMPITYNYLTMNVQVNKLESIIECINGAVLNSLDDKSIEVDCGNTGLGAKVSQNDPLASTLKIPILNLNTLIKDLKETGIVIKMDCEGCEYSSILNLTPDTLFKIDEIMLEYHSGFRSICSFLIRNNFSVELSDDFRKSVGIMYAKNNR